LEIPNAACAGGPDVSGLFRKAADRLREERAHTARIRLLEHFADLVERQSAESLSAFCDLVLANQTMLATFNNDPSGREAMAVLRAIQGVAGIAGCRLLASAVAVEAPGRDRQIGAQTGQPGNALGFELSTTAEQAAAGQSGRMEAAQAQKREEEIPDPALPADADVQAAGL
jgi:hypothetical protein